MRRPRFGHREVAVAELLESRRLLAFSTSFPSTPPLSQRADVNTSPVVPGNELYPGNQANEGESLVVVNPVNPREIFVFAVDLDASGNVTADKAWRSTDGGASFAPPSIVLLPAGHSGRGDPAAAFDRAGNLYYVHLTSTGGPSTTHVSVAKWPNGASTWTHATTVLENASLGIDKPWITVGPKPGSPNEEVIYVLYRPPLGAPTRCVRSLDGGLTFQNDVEIPGGGHFQHVVASYEPEDDGRLYAVYQKDVTGPPAGTEIRLNYSTNGGVTWQTNDLLVGTTPVRKTEWSTQFFLPSPHGIHPVPSVAVANTGDYGNDNISGGAGNDTIYGGAGNDLLDGGDDNDLFYAIDGSDWEDTVLGGKGSDEADLDLDDLFEDIEVVNY
jgi:Ca2+-binding RTX toxin-like protein